MEYYHKNETLSRDALVALQEIRLRNTLERIRKTDFYRNKLQDCMVAESCGVENIHLLPFTEKSDLRAQYPTGLLTMPLSQVERMHASSGTTGNPTAILYSRNDLNTWADLMARCMYMVGMRSRDIFQNMSGYGLFTGGLGIHYGAERLGCLTIPAGAGNSRRQIKMLQDFQVSSVHIIPSYALHLSSVFVEMGIDPRDLSLRVALIGAEPHTEEIRRRIEDFYGIKAYNSYGLSEMNGPGVAFECQAQDGLHVWEDAYVPEIVDPVTGRPVAEGEVGELVLTSLCREAMPLLRYRTRDLTRFLPGQCACGRKHRRLDRILGRCDDMIILKGVNIYPMQIEKILMSVPEVGENYVIELVREEFLESMRVKVEIRAQCFVEDMRVLRGLQDRITYLLRDEILITPRVDLVQPGSLPKSEGKALRVVDLRAQTQG